MKINKKVNVYALVTQGIISLFVLMAIGYGIGYLIDKNSAWPGILAVIGGLCGLGSLIITAFKLSGEDDG